MAMVPALLAMWNASSTISLEPTIADDELNNAELASALRDRADMNWRTSERDLEEETFVMDRLWDPRT